MSEEKDKKTFSEHNCLGNYLRDENKTAGGIPLEVIDYVKWNIFGRKEFLPTYHKEDFFVNENHLLVKNKNIEKDSTVLAVLVSYYKSEDDAELSIWNETMGFYYEDFESNSYNQEKSSTVSIPFTPICLPNMVHKPKVKLHQLTLGEYNRALKKIEVNYPQNGNENSSDLFHHFRLRECSSSDIHGTVISNPSCNSLMAYYLFFCSEKTNTYMESDLIPDIDIFLSSSKNEVFVLSNREDFNTKEKSALATKIASYGNVLILENTECVRNLINSSFVQDDQFNVFVIATTHGGLVVTDNLKKFMEDNPPEKNTHVSQYTMRHIFGSDHTNERVLHPKWEYLLTQGGDWLTMAALLDFGLNSPHRNGDKHYGKGTTHRYRTLPGTVIMVVPEGEPPIHTPNTKMGHYFDQVHGNLLLGNATNMTLARGKANNISGCFNLRPPTNGQCDEDYDSDYNSDDDDDDSDYQNPHNVVRDLQTKREQIFKDDSVPSKKLLLTIPSAPDGISYDDLSKKYHPKTTEHTIRWLLVCLLDSYRVKISYVYALIGDSDTKSATLNNLCSSFRKTWDYIMLMVPEKDHLDQQSVNNCLKSRLAFTNKLLNFDCDYLAEERDHQNLFGSVENFILLAVEKNPLVKLYRLVYPHNFQHVNGLSVSSSNFFNLRMLCGVAMRYGVSKHFMDLQSHRKGGDKLSVGFFVSEKASVDVCGCGCYKDQESVGKYYYFGLPEIIKSGIKTISPLNTPDIEAYFMQKCKNQMLGSEFIDHDDDNDDEDDGECEKQRENALQLLKCFDNCVDSEFLNMTLDSYNEIRPSVKIHFNNNERWNYLTALVQKLMDGDLGNRCAYNSRKLAITIANTILAHMGVLKGVFCYEMLLEKTNFPIDYKVENTYNMLRYIIDNVLPLAEVRVVELEKYVETLGKYLNVIDLNKKGIGQNIPSLLDLEKTPKLSSISHEEINNCMQTFLLNLLVTISKEWQKFLNHYAIDNVTEIAQFVKLSSKTIIEALNALQKLCKNEFGCEYVTSNKNILPISIYHRDLLNYFIGREDIKVFGTNSFEALKDTRIMKSSVLYRGLVMVFLKLCDLATLQIRESDEETNVKFFEAYTDLLLTSGKVYMSCRCAGIEMSKSDSLDENVCTKHKFNYFWRGIGAIQMKSNVSYDDKMTLNQIVKQINYCKKKKYERQNNFPQGLCNNNKRNLLNNDNYYMKKMCTGQPNIYNW